MATKRTRELRLLPGEDVPRGAAKRSTAAKAAAQARTPKRRAGRNPFSPGPPQGAAKGYRCSILSGRGAGARLDFCSLPSGVIEFDVIMALSVMHSVKTDAGSGPVEC
jgi:hypothetical protein